MFSVMAASLLAVAAALVSVARHTAGRPPLWRSKAAFVGAVICLVFGTGLVVADPASLFETPILLVAAICAFEGYLAWMNLRAAAGRPAPKWLL